MGGGVPMHDILQQVRLVSILNLFLIYVIAALCNIYWDLTITLYYTNIGEYVNYNKILFYIKITKKKKQFFFNLIEYFFILYKCRNYIIYIIMSWPYKMIQW